MTTLKQAWHNNSVGGKEPATLLTVQAYRYHRRKYRNDAPTALKLARADAAAGKRRYSSPVYAYNPEGEAWGFHHCRWIEDAHEAGLRLVGTAYDVSRKNDSRCVDHGGWYVDQDQTVAVPMVFRLPSRKGQSVFAYGYEDYNNPGSYYLCFANDRETELEAAKAADRMTESMAEEERTYQEAWQNGRQYDDLGDEIKAERIALRELIVELRAFKADPESAICRTLRSAVREALWRLNRLRKERAELKSDWGHMPGFVE
jgi:hypothetical protein